VFGGESLGCSNSRNFSNCFPVEFAGKMLLVFSGEGMRSSGPIPLVLLFGLILTVLLPTSCSERHISINMRVSLDVSECFGLEPGSFLFPAAAAGGSESVASCSVVSWFGCRLCPLWCCKRCMWLPCHWYKCLRWACRRSIVSIVDWYIMRRKFEIVSPLVLCAAYLATLLFVPD